MYFITVTLLWEDLPFFLIAVAQYRVGLPPRVKYGTFLADRRANNLTPNA